LKVQIYGAGSAGVHLARACLNEGYTVSVYDTDPNAYSRFEGLYFDRYKEMAEGKIFFGLNNQADYFIVATPPDTHLKIVQEIRGHHGNVPILVEKPLCLPLEVKDMPNVKVNYNHLFSEGYQELLKMFGLFGKPDHIEVCWQESVDYILKAHPWIASIKDSYLGHSSRGGGSAFEHSHGLACVLGLFSGLNRSDITEFRVSKTGADYDECMEMNFHVRGIPTTVNTDFTSKTVKKSIVIMRGENHIGLSFTAYDDDLAWSSGDKSFSRTREQQFSLGLKGAIHSPLNTYSIGKLAVQLIGEAHSLT